MKGIGGGLLLFCEAEEEEGMGCHNVAMAWYSVRDMERPLRRAMGGDWEHKQQSNGKQQLGCQGEDRGM